MKPNKYQLLSIGALASIPMLSSCGNKLPETKPNIIYILMDDMGYGEAGCYGQEKIETPNLDRLASEGILFTQHYSTSPVSAPSRCGLMTGQHMGHSQVRGNDEVGSRGNVWSHHAMFDDPGLEGQTPIKAGTITLGRLMQKAGYTTGCVGKWGLGYPGSEGTPNKQGFDFFFGYNCQRQAHTYYPPFLWKNEERVYLNNKTILEPGKDNLDKGADPYDIHSYDKYTQGQYSPDVMFDELMQFVEDNKNGKFFLMWTNPVPHVSLQAPKEAVDRYVDKFGDEEPYLSTKGYFPCRYPHATYAAMITHFDAQLGKLIDKLKELGLYDNTIIMFTSDNGPTFNGGTDSPWFNSGGLFKSEQGWGKCSLHEGGIRVPFIVTWKDVIKPGRKSDLISYFPDMMPTLCEIAGVDAPKNDGISIVPTLLGKEKKQPTHEFLYWEYPEAGGSKAIRYGQWKGLIQKIKKGNDTMQLFNLDEDIQEQHDVAAEHPEIVAKMREFMAASHEEPENPRFKM